MTEYPFAPSGAGILVTAQGVTNATATIGGGEPGKRAVRLVNRAATAVFVKAGDTTVDATNTDYTLNGSSSGILLVGANTTTVSVKASTGSNSPVLVQPGYVL
jgi:phage baseplate assembly protein gpV